MRRLATRAASGTCSVLLAAAVVVSGVSAQDVVEYAYAPAAGVWGPPIERARVTIDSVMRANEIPGISVAVSVDGRVVWSEGFGFANVETRTPVSGETKFRIGSISKPLTAAGLALLVESGAVDLDAPVQRYVPSFPEKAKGRITTRLLGGHLAGVRHYRGDEFENSRRYASVTEGLEVFADDTLLTVPGTRYSYSSYGWSLISAVMEGASGQDFLPYMTEHVLVPLDMRNTVADYTDSIIVGRTGYYGRSPDGTILNEPFVDNSYKWAGGGFLSTPEDLLTRGYLLNISDHYMLWSWRSRLRSSAVARIIRGIAWSSTSSSPRREVAWRTWSGSAGRRAFGVADAGNA